jgi:molybdenum cofactor biosynthesis enzyme MoaA
MYVGRILTNETCNQRCSFCTERRAAERPSISRTDAVLRRIDAALAGGMREIVLTGGEPTLRRDLPGLVAHARRAGATSVVLETNGALLGGERAATLAQAGLARARVHVPIWGEGADEISQDEGGFSRTIEGMQALVRAGLALEIATPIVRANLGRVAEIPGAIAASGLPVEAIIVSVPVSSPDPAALVSLFEAARAIEAIEAAARRVGIEVRIEPNAPIAPCFFSHPSRVAHLFALTPGGATRDGFGRLPACGACSVRDRCPGVPQAALVALGEQAAAVRPIVEDRTRRRLSLVSSVKDQIERELVTRDTRRLTDGTLVRENIVRINFQCNQSCRFCFVSTHLPPAKEAAIVAAIHEIAADRGVLTLSGGEPTLNAKLVDYVRLGKQLGVREVELQTNAIRLADPALTASLAEAGVDVVFVSLHGSTAEISDGITEAPGTFARTILGLDQLVKTRMALGLNFVFCEDNYADFPAYVSLVAARWPRAKITVSFVAASTDLVPRDRTLIPRYSDIMPDLAAGLRIALREGVAIAGFEGMCGVPLCLVPQDVSSYFSLAEIPPGTERGAFTKPDPCLSCSLERRCFGLRKSYVELHGASEVRPLREPGGGLPGASAGRPPAG